MTTVSAEDRFQFDLQGYLLLKGALAEKDRVELLDEVRRQEERTHDDSRWRKPWPDGRIGQETKQVSPGFLRLNGLLRMSEKFDRIIDYPTVFPYLQDFLAGDPQLLNTWSITKTAGIEAGQWHRGVEPTQYSARNGRIRSQMLNVVYFLTENRLDNGCMSVIPGGHKSNFDLDWGKYKGLELPGSIPVLGQPGDVLLFSEALLHNGIASTCPEKRTNLYFNYGTRDFNVMTYSPEHNFHFAMPPHVRARFTPARLKASSWMEHVQTVD
jgi:ectoine hydroxylase-related dioxygenase (phytanoyl-CoA dioxygenase family)